MKKILLALLLAGCGEAVHEKELQKKINEADCKSDHYKIFSSSMSLAIEASKYPKLNKLYEDCNRGFIDEKVSCDSVQKIVHKFNREMHIHLTK